MGTSKLPAQEKELINDEPLIEDREIAAVSRNKNKRVISETTHILSIRIDGNRKIERDAILSKIKTREGMILDKNIIREDVASLFNMGYFFDIEVHIEKKGEGVELTFKVKEKPSMNEIKYVGNSEISEEDLKEHAELKPYEILNMSKVNRAIDKMLKLYEDKGYFLARINYEITDDVPDESVKLTFNIEENDHVILKKINIIGNRHISDSKIKEAMASKEGGFFSFISGSGAYKQEVFDRDMSVINFLYFNEGFVQVKIDRPEVHVTPDKKNIYITIQVDEGEQFFVGDLDFTGDLLFSEKELLETIQIKDSKVFSYEALQKDLDSLRAKYGDLGYAFVNVIPRPNIREKDHKVDVTFEIEKGQKVYFGKINVVGNSRTRDKVVRRELTIFEGELYNETRKRESQDNIRRLGYFDDVSFTTKTPEGQMDRLNIDINVKERNTGSIQLGAGYSTYQGATFTGNVTQANLFGLGYRIGASVNLDNKQSLYDLSFADPYFLDTQWSMESHLYQTDREHPDQYEEIKTGGAFGMGHPLAPFLHGRLRYKYEEAKIKLFEDADPELFGGGNGSTSSLTMTLEYDKRNDRFLPSEGIFASASLEYAGLGGTKKFTRGSTNFRYYLPLFWKVVFRNNLSYAFISSNTEDEPPFNELFLLGGANNLRGFNWYSIGKKRYSNKKYLELKTLLSEEDAQKGAWVSYGGTQQIFYNAEMEFPLISEAGIKGVLFFDIGSADDILRTSDLRSDIGFGFRWFSPIGPLRFEWGFPIDRRPDLGEESHSFHFAIGSPF